MGRPDPGCVIIFQGAVTAVACHLPADCFKINRRLLFMRLHILTLRGYRQRHGFVGGGAEQFVCDRDGKVSHGFFVALSRQTATVR